MARGVMVASSLVAAAGCTSRGWYEGFRADAVARCEARPGADRAECRRAHGLSYDDYEAARRGAAAG